MCDVSERTKAEGPKREMDWISPSGIIRGTLTDLEDAKTTLLTAVDEIDYSIRVIRAGQDYWEGVEPTTFQETSTGGSAIAYLNSLAQEASALTQGAGSALSLVRTFNSTAAVYGAVVATSYTFVQSVEGFDPGKVSDMIDRPGRDKEYALKFSSFDAELGRLYRQILEIRSRTTSHPEKSILSDLRQAYDQLMRKLAPDEEVRAQAGWEPRNPQKPKMVTRRQRLEYAIQKHVHNGARKETLLAISEHALNVHSELSRLYHTEKAIALEGARAATQAMLEVLNLWADGLDL